MRKLSELWGKVEVHTWNQHKIPTKKDVLSLKMSIFKWKVMFSNDSPILTISQNFNFKFRNFFLFCWKCSDLHLYLISRWHCGNPLISYGKGFEAIKIFRRNFHVNPMLHFKTLGARVNIFQKIGQQFAGSTLRSPEKNPVGSLAKISENFKIRTTLTFNLVILIIRKS